MNSLQNNTFPKTDIDYLTQKGREYYEIIAKYFRGVHTGIHEEANETITPDILFLHDSRVVGPLYYPENNCIHMPVSFFLNGENLIPKELMDIGIFLVIAHEFGHAFEENNYLTLDTRKREGFADTFSGYIARQYGLSETEFRGALDIYYLLGEIAIKQSEKANKSNIHGSGIERVRYFLDGYMMNSFSFNRYIESLPKTKKELYAIKNHLLRIIQNSESRK